jgi:hypothetical protein
MLFVVVSEHGAARCKIGGNSLFSILRFSYSSAHKPSPRRKAKSLVNPNRWWG